MCHFCPSWGSRSNTDQMKTYTEIKKPPIKQQVTDTDTTRTSRIKSTTITNETNERLQRSACLHGCSAEPVSVCRNQGRGIVQSLLHILWSPDCCIYSECVRECAFVCPCVFSSTLKVKSPPDLWTLSTLNVGEIKQTLSKQDPYLNGLIQRLQRGRMFGAKGKLSGGEDGPGCFI